MLLFKGLKFNFKIIIFLFICQFTYNCFAFAKDVPIPPHATPSNIKIKVNQYPPDFTLPDLKEKKVTLSSFRGKQSVLLVFYRGFW